MLGINYASSDEEEVVPPKEIKIPTPDKPKKVVSAPNPKANSASEQVASSAPINGPAQGPSLSLAPAGPGPSDDGIPGSPYTSTQSLIRELTLPTVPNFEIPPSPPGSPPLNPTRKFGRFLLLKKRGQHFNQRLESSSVLKDPGHLQTLMDFAKISDEDQYASSLPDGIAIPSKFPKWAYFEELSASQKRITKSREEANTRVPRDGIDFVPATGSGASSGAGTPSGKSLRQSAAERVMAGLDRQQSGKRKDLEHRGGRSQASSSSRRRSSSRSPKRRRSRSRERR
ncbi:hypothetical protein BU24DRAFT_450566 [Aaosphaeria arxii CBS 175.79]|uniref:HCNGP-domain-containing protein n=1 Tax=Aaosphaeria arxii CBS 175.79 TaxID=1450172 RepID=A0A6A5XSP9_9PLEO|nr:uncharacterized protein BU24DRAFT_450566 [Aaosphaeria arxii CBS 175.79]KAF2015936.1 hypothetical protein BU24DRAFT_450566 [Aaosphaeria arxii CBS 175.79]